MAKEVIKMTKYIVVIFGVAAIVYSISTLAQRSPDTDNELNAHQVFQMQSEGTATLVDVRTAEEYRSGHIRGAIHIPLSEISSRSINIEPEDQIVLYCRSGRRARIAAGILSDRGFSNISILNGQFSGWRASGLPTGSGVN